MSLVILVIAVLLIILGICWSCKTDLGDLIAILGVIVLLISLVMIVINSVKVVKGRTYEKKIEMYQKENAKIEQQIDSIVLNFIEHEDKTFGNAKNEGNIALVSLYPELKSDSLVKEQIKIYNNNNSKIKFLKESDIDTMTAKWWLYFGK